VTLGLRVTADMKNRIDAEAMKHGRSLSQEAELRLERSFETQSLLPQVLELAYGEGLAALMADIGFWLELTVHAATIDEVIERFHETIADTSTSPQERTRLKRILRDSPGTTGAMRHISVMYALACLRHYFHDQIDFDDAVRESGLISVQRLIKTKKSEVAFRAR
jgi:hypothetical protein